MFPAGDCFNNGGEMEKQRVVVMMPRLLAILAVVVILGAALGAGSALAARGGIKGKPDGNGGNGGKNNGGYGVCYVTPDPVAAGDDYTIVGSDFKAGQLLGVQIKDSTGTTVFNVSADATGSFSLSWHAYWTGTSTVSINDISHRKTVSLTSCSFEVI
jgi:hypothetical protein